MNQVYSIVTDQIIKIMESGVIPWTQPWNNYNPHQNPITKTKYKGINRILLSCAHLIQKRDPFDSNLWMTMNEINALNGRVITGQKSTMLIFWKPEVIKESKDNPEEYIIIPPVLRYYRVFNLDQTSGIDKSKFQTQAQQILKPNTDPIAECESIVNKYTDRPEIGFDKNSNSAFYNPVFDKVVTPPKETFISQKHYYATLFHELAHSTGHQSRINRSLIKNYFHSREDRSKEELIAEMSAAFLCTMAGINSNELIENQASYIDGWLSVFNKDKTILISAAAQAEKASNYIQGIKE